MTHILIWLLLYPPVAALTTGIDAQLSGIGYDDGAARGLMWWRIATYLIGIMLLVTLHYV